MSLSKTLEKVRKAYASMTESPYPTRWFTTGQRRVEDILIIDDDFEIEQIFLNRVVSLVKTVRMEGGNIHTRLESMTLHDADDNDTTYSFAELQEMCKEMGIMEE